MKEVNKYKEELESYLEVVDRLMLIDVKRIDELDAILNDETLNDFFKEGTIKDKIVELKISLGKKEAIKEVLCHIKESAEKK